MTCAVCNGIFYLVQTGCQWRALPHEYLPYQTVYDYFTVYDYVRQWRDSGVWQQLNDPLRARTRTTAGRDASPCAAILDSQSVPMATQPGRRGYDGHKCVKGRKRHSLVDTLGLLLAVVVLSATIDDRVGAKATFLRLEWRFPRLRHLWADGGYGGRFIDWVHWAYGWMLEIVSSQCNRPAGGGWWSRNGAGWSNAPSPGWVVRGGCARTTKHCRARKKHCATPRCVG